MSEIVNSPVSTAFAVYRERRAFSIGIFCSCNLKEIPSPMLVISALKLVKIHSFKHYLLQNRLELWLESLWFLLVLVDADIRITKLVKICFSMECEAYYSESVKCESSSLEVTETNLSL